MENRPFTNAQVKQLEGLLTGQTREILNAVDARIQGFEISIRTEMRELRHEIKELAERVNELTTTIDAFLKRMTTIEDEFDAVKYEINRMKTFLKEKLGYIE